MDLSIIIPTRNREEILFHSLKYFLSSVTKMDAEIIIINDGDKNILLPEEWTAKTRIIRNPEKGVASARNLGAKNALSDTLVFMDDDMLINQTSLNKTMELIQQYPDATINLNWIYPPELSKKIEQTKFGRYLNNYGFTSLKGWNTGQPWNDAELFESTGVTSQFLALRKHTFNLVNGYDESFPHAGFEDYDFAKRLREKGVHFYIWPKEMIYHNETDRLELDTWLERKRRGGETRKHAVLRGNMELALHYSGLKKIILHCFAATKKIWIALLDLLPNITFLDGFYGRMVNILLATSIFEGYTKARN